jgi:hypothetical protein
VPWDPFPLQGIIRYVLLGYRLVANNIRSKFLNFLGLYVMGITKLLTGGGTARVGL